MNRKKYFNNLFQHLREGISQENRANSIAAEVIRLESEGGIPAQLKPDGKKWEEIFTSEFLVQHIADFHLAESFRDHFDLTEQEVKEGLAYEGWNQKSQSSFGSSPIIESGFKTLISKTRGISSWKKQSTSHGGLYNFAPCPDLAFKRPLPFTAVGDVKYVKDSDGLSLDQVLTGLEDAIREIFFYYAALNLGREKPFYESGFLIVADATKDQLVSAAIKDANPGLEDRFYSTSGFFPLVLDVAS